MKFSISRSLLVSAVNHKAARTFREKKTKKQESFFPLNPSGEDHVIAEVKFSISRSSLVSAVNHKAARTFREKKTKRQESFFPLNFNVYINYIKEMYKKVCCTSKVVFLLIKKKVCCTCKVVVVVVSLVRSIVVVFYLSFSFVLLYFIFF